MSGQNGELYHHRDDFPFNEDLSSIFSDKPDVGHTITQDLHCLDPLPIPMMSFTDYLHGSSYYGSLSRAFDLSFSPTPDVFASGEEEKSVTDMVVETSNVNGNNMSGVGTPITPISSVSSSSTEAAGEEDSGRCIKDDLKPEEELQELPKRDDDRGDSSKKVSRPRKKGEKRQRESRFAFVTKSDVDHLEDGYRWRKYGQKAVKNSPYPRSYYRCTTQKCSVKKRVERSFQDPTVVITTYEGQHTHHSPANIRGGSHMVAPPPTLSTSFLRDPMMQQLHPLINNGQQREMNPSMYFTSLQQLNLPDYGLLQDIVPAFINNIQP